MAPRKTRAAAAKKVISSSSSFSEPFLGADVVNMRNLTKSGKAVPDPNATNIFDLAEESPMKSPSKFGEEMLLQTPTRSRGIAKAPRPSPLKQDPLFFEDYRRYDFVASENDRTLLIFGLRSKINGGTFDPKRLITSLFKVTAPGNHEQLAWLASSIDEIMSLRTYEEFFAWFKAGATIKRSVRHWALPWADRLMSLFQVALKYFLEAWFTLMYTLLFIGLFVYLLHRVGYFSEEDYAYFRVIGLIFSLLLYRDVE